MVPQQQQREKDIEREIGRRAVRRQGSARERCGDNCFYKVITYYCHTQLTYLYITLSICPEFEWFRGNSGRDRKTWREREREREEEGLLGDNYIRFSKKGCREMV